jgi:hypothetical protein
MPWSSCLSLHIINPNEKSAHIPRKCLNFHNWFICRAFVQVHSPGVEAPSHCITVLEPSHRRRKTSPRRLTPLPTSTHPTHLGGPSIHLPCKASHPPGDLAAKQNQLPFHPFCSFRAHFVLFIHSKAAESTAQQSSPLLPTSV